MILSLKLLFFICSNTPPAPLWLTAVVTLYGGLLIGSYRGRSLRASATLG